MAEHDTPMADPAPGDDVGAGRGRDYPGLPRWVKISGIIVLVVVLLVGIILVTGIGGPHGPGRHLPSGAQPSSQRGPTLPSRITESRAYQPWV